ncbi:Ger(x)C family spore germination protein [Paenibacillus hemerocallicola]|nr:Ger(x)C family spore germination protein [Paenibacillus hemerocallicola]
MRKAIRVVTMLVLGCTILTGCWDRRELNDLAIAVGIGMDRDGSQVQVTAQIVNPAEVASKKGGGGYSTPVTILSATEKTFFEALRKLTTVAPRRVFASHLRVLIIGEDLARQGIEKVMDGISRNHEFRSDFFLIVAKGARADEVLEILTPIEKIPANKMFNTLEMSERVWAPTVKMPLDRFISDLSDPSKDAVLTGIRIEGDQEAGRTKGNVGKTGDYTKLQYSGLALFKGDKLIDWLNDEESKGYNYIMDNVKNTVGHLTCPKGDELTVEVVRASSKVTGKVAGGKPKIEVHIFAEENVGEVQCEVDLTKTETIEQLEALAEQKLKKIITASIRKAQKHKADIFGFGEAIEDADPKAWLDMKRDWGSRFAELDVSVRTDVEIRRLGTTNNSLLEKRK